MIQPMQHLSLLVFYKDYSSFVEELRGRGVLHIYEDKKKSAENVELGKKLVLLRQVNEISRLFVKRSRENACLPEGQALQWEQASSARDRLLFYCRLPDGKPVFISVPPLLTAHTADTAAGRPP